MRVILLALAVPLAAACGGASSSPVHAPTAQAEAAEAVELRVSSDTRLTNYARAQSVTIRDLGGHQVRVASVGTLQLRREDETGERFVRYLTHGPLEYRRDGEEQPLPSSMTGLERHQVRTVVDARNHILEGPALNADMGRGQVSAAVLALARLLEPYLPDEPVRVGDEWAEPPVVWDTPPLNLATVEIERRFRLLGIEGEGPRRRARIGWDVELRIRPFEVSGVSVEGRGTIEGFSLVSLADGVAVRSSLDLVAEAGPAGASDMLPLLRIEAKVQDEITRLVAPPAPVALRR